MSGMSANWCNSSSPKNPATTWPSFPDYSNSYRNSGAEVKEAIRQAEDIIKNAHEAAVLDKNRLMAELKQHIGELVVQTTEKVAGKVLTPDDQARLNSETLRQLGANNN